MPPEFVTEGQYGKVNKTNHQNNSFLGSGFMMHGDHCLRTAALRNASDLPAQ